MGNDGSNSLEGSHVSCAAGTNTALLGRGIDGNEDHVGFANALGDVGSEEKVGRAARYDGLAIFGRGQLTLGGTLAGEGEVAGTISSNADNVVQARLVNRGVARVPTSNARFVSVDNRHLDVRVLEGNDGSGRAT